MSLNSNKSIRIINITKINNNNNIKKIINKKNHIAILKTTHTNVNPTYISTNKYTTISLKTTNPNFST